MKKEFRLKPERPCSMREQVIERTGGQYVKVITPSVSVCEPILDNVTLQRMEDVGEVLTIMSENL